MKKSYIFICLLFVVGISSKILAQTDPGTVNLTHQWTFDNGSGTDIVGNSVATIIGTGSFTNNAFVATNAYLELPAAELAINTYPELTTEIWCTSSAGKNSGWTMLNYFGESINGGGANFTFLSIARGDNQTRAELGTSANNYSTSSEYDDGKLHHFVYTISESMIHLFIDGVQVDADSLKGGNSLSKVSTSLAYLGRGGWTADPNWIGTYHKFSLYNKALSGEEVLYLYQHGAEEKSVITSTVSSLAFDSNYPAEIFSVSSSNLSDDITVTAPAGITVFPTTITKNTNDVSVTAIFDMSASVDGKISLTSGSTTVEIPVKSADDTECYVPLYTDIQNLNDDPGLNNLSNFGGWGTKSIVTVIDDADKVYCGAASASVGNGTTTGSGSLDMVFTNTGKLVENTTYKVKAMVKTIGGTFNIGVWGWTGDASTINAFDTKGEWMPIEFTFTTGPTFGATQGMYFNNWACTGTLGYIDNWEMYIAPDPIITLSKKQLSFDADVTSDIFTVTSSNLSSDITLSAPAGITLSKSTLPAESKNDTVMVTFDGTTSINDSITLTGDSKVVKIAVRTLTTSSSSCFTPMYSDRPNLVVDPYLNSLADFGGWGDKSIMQNIDSAYCGSRCGMIAGSGSIDIKTSGLLVPNSIYTAKAMVKTFGTFQMGVFGFGGIEFTDTIDTKGEWQAMNFEFTTGETVSDNSGVYFNNWSRSGKRGYIDNWELYKKDTVSAVNNVSKNFENIFIQNGKIVADFDLDTKTTVHFIVYNIQGAMISEEKYTGLAGRNRKELNVNLTKGIYFVRLVQNGYSEIKKIVKY